jgi:hypothetical protein
MKETTIFAFYTICFTHVVFPQSFNSNSRQWKHNLENKNLENNKLEGENMVKYIKNSCQKNIKLKKNSFHENTRK